MSFGYIFAAFLLAHILADFGVRREIIGRRRSAPAQPAWRHLAVFVVLSAAALAPAGPFALLLAVLAAGVHFLVDEQASRGGLWKPEPGLAQRWVFALEQGLKMLTVTLISFALLRILDQRFDVEPWLPMPALAYMLGYSIAIFGGDAFVSFVLTRLDWEDDSTPGAAEGAGRLIGIFEAILVTTFVMGYQYGAVGLVLAAKSVARFEWLKDKQGRAEYFLIGTLANLTCALAGGLIALWLAGAPLFLK